MSGGVECGLNVRLLCLWQPPSIAEVDSWLLIARVESREWWGGRVAHSIERRGGCCWFLTAPAARGRVESRSWDGDWSVQLARSPPRCQGGWNAGHGRYDDI